MSKHYHQKWFVCDLDLCILILYDMCYVRFCAKHSLKRILIIVSTKNVSKNCSLFFNVLKNYTYTYFCTNHLKGCMKALWKQKESHTIKLLPWSKVRPSFKSPDAKHTYIDLVKVNKFGSEVLFTIQVLWNQDHETTCKLLASSWICTQAFVKLAIIHTFCFLMYRVAIN